jgi:enhancer of yellow 2 transcription factor
MASHVNRPPTPEPADDTEEKLEDKIRYQLQATGERDRLKHLLASKLEANGWRAEVKERCKEYVAKQGRENVAVDDIVKAVRNQARGLVPDSIKVRDRSRLEQERMRKALAHSHAPPCAHALSQAELLGEIKRFILSL